MTDDPDIFSQRLLLAFTHLSKEQQDAIQQRMAQQGIGGGIKSGIARLVGIRTPSMLSDMLAGRVRGTRYRSQLADLLGVTERWLMGDDADQPDWAIPATEAYQRFCRRLRLAWAGKTGSTATEPLDPDADDSSSNRMWMAWLHDERNQPQEGSQGRAAITAALAIDDRAAGWLAAGRFERVEFAVLQRFNAWLGLPALTHPEAARSGHRTVQNALSHQEWVERTIEERIERYALPDDLFAVVRESLMAQRLKLQGQQQSTLIIDDGLEMLWRQHLRRGHGMGRPPVPREFTAETGRTAWTEPTVIHNRSRTRQKVGSGRAMQKGASA